MERPEDRKFFYEERKKPKNVQLAFMARPELRDRIDSLKMPGEKRSAVLRRILDVGIPIVERQMRIIRSPQAKLGPIAEEDKEQ